MPMTMTQPARAANLAVFLGFVDLFVDRHRLEPDHARRLKLVVEEAVANVVQHAYPRGSGDLTLTADVADGVAVFTLQDHGTPFDPADAPPPDLTADWRERRIGGLGWHLIRELAEGVSYLAGDPEGGRPNTLTLRVGAVRGGHA